MWPARLTEITISGLFPLLVFGFNSPDHAKAGGRRLSHANPTAAYVHVALHELIMLQFSKCVSEHTQERDDQKGKKSRSSLMLMLMLMLMLLNTQLLMQ